MAPKVDNTPSLRPELATTVKLKTVKLVFRGKTASPQRFPQLYCCVHNECDFSVNAAYDASSWTLVYFEVRCESKLFLMCVKLDETLIPPPLPVSV